MVSAHFWMKAYSVKDAAVQSPGMHVRYLNREGEFDPAKYVTRESTRTKDYGDYIIGDVRNLPAWAEGDASRFFTEAAQHERANGYYAFQVQFSLPRELTHEQGLALTSDFMEATMPDLPALWVKHEKVLENGELHPHIHILFSARKQDEIERDPRQMFARWNRRHPDQGGCEKDLLWSQRQAPEQLRHAFADISNYHLNQAGAEERLDPRALKRREIRRAPLRSADMARPDAATLAREQAQAVAAWEQRKAYKGIEDIQAIPREEFVLLVRQWTREYERGRAIPRPSRQELEQERAALVARGQELEDALWRLERSIAYAERLERREQQRAPALTRGRTEAPRVQRGYDPRGRIFDQGQGR